MTKMTEATHTTHDQQLSGRHVGFFSATIWLSWLESWAGEFTMIVFFNVLQRNHSFDIFDIFDINTETFSFTGKKKGLNLSRQLSLFWWFQLKIFFSGILGRFYHLSSQDEKIFGKKTIFVQAYIFRLLGNLRNLKI